MPTTATSSGTGSTAVAGEGSVTVNKDGTVTGTNPIIHRNGVPAGVQRPMVGAPAVGLQRPIPVGAIPSVKSPTATQSGSVAVDSPLVEAQQKRQQTAQIRRICEDALIQPQSVNGTASVTMGYIHEDRLHACLQMPEETLLAQHKKCASKRQDIPYFAAGQAHSANAPMVSPYGSCMHPAFGKAR